MIRKIIYSISILSFCFFTFSIIEMLPIIFQSRLPGLLFLFSAFSLILLELILLVKRKELIQNSWTYNLLVIVTTMYLSIIYYKIYSISSTDISFYYNIDIHYCEFNYLILTLILVFIMIHILFLKKEQKEKNL